MSFDLSLIMNQFEFDEKSENISREALIKAYYTKSVYHYLTGEFDLSLKEFILQLKVFETNQWLNRY